MKILHLLYSGLGGTGNVFFSMMQADEKKLFEYEVVFVGVENIRQEYLIKSNLYNLQCKFIRKRSRLDIPFSRHLFNTIRSSVSTIIVLHGSRFILLAKIAAIFSKSKKKIIVIETQCNQLKTRYEWIWFILAMLCADHLVFLTREFKEEIIKKLPPFLRPQNCSIINNGIDLAMFKPGTKSPRQMIKLGMQSRVIAIKDHSTLLRAFAQLRIEYPELLLYLKIAGDGEALPAMKELASQLDINNEVQFTGLLDEPELVDFLQSLDIYIHASFGEAMSTAIMQAMACKLPIIASDVPGINNMITDQVTGLLVPVQNKTALARAIYSLVTDCPKAKLLKEAAFNFARSHYSNANMFSIYRDLFKSLTRNGANGAAIIQNGQTPQY